MTGQAESRSRGAGVERRSASLVAAVSVPAGVAAGLLGLLAGWVLAVVLAVVVTAAVATTAVVVVWRGAEQRVLVAIDGHRVDPTADARLLNVVDGLCVAAGIRQPTVVVVERPGRNIAAVGQGTRPATLVVTRGLLDALTLLELEAVVATQVARIRHERMGPATVASSLPAQVGRFVAPLAAEDLITDRGGASLTRYPPALASALTKIADDPTSVEGRVGTGELWLVDPSPGVAPSSGRAGLALRLAALREL